MLILRGTPDSRRRGDRYDGHMSYADDREQLRHVRRPLGLRPVERESAVLLLIVALIVLGFLIGLLVGYEGAR